MTLFALFIIIIITIVFARTQTGKLKSSIKTHFLQTVDFFLFKNETLFRKTYSQANTPNQRLNFF